MGYTAKFEGWDKLTLEDLIVAYRKAKADCYFDSSFPTAIKFAEYERDLIKNLKALLSHLNKNAGFLNDEDLLGECRLVPKKLGRKAKENAHDGHVHFSNPARAFENIIKNYTLTPEFRVIGDFPVNTHIISALWINRVGHKFDQCLSDNCYGARLKRLPKDELNKDAEKDFHITAVGSFVPYFRPYQQWRNDGLEAIRGELEKERDVLAASLDLKSYYHHVDPMAIASESLHQELGLQDEKQLSAFEKKFTHQLATFLTAWSTKADDFAKSLSDEAQEIKGGGLVIGLTAVRIISNVLLYCWDKKIKEEICPVHYGRYVDDMFLVMRDSGTINNTHDFMMFLQKRLGADFLFESNGLWHIQQGEDFQKETQIQLQTEKQKLFILQGQAGLDLLDSIASEIQALSSEHRLMPSPDQLDDTTAARVLSAAGDVGEQADNLRRADGLTVRRLSWSLQLRHVEFLARDLPKNEWKTQREEFYQFAHNHILRPDNFFTYFNHLPRLLGFAISLNEWAQAERIVRKSFECIDLVEKQVAQGAKIILNGQEAKSDKQLWKSLRESLSWKFIDAGARYYDSEKLLDSDRTKNETRLTELFVNVIVADFMVLKDGKKEFSEKLMNIYWNYKTLHEYAALLVKTDLASKPYKKIVTTKAISLLLVDLTDSEEEICAAFEQVELLDISSLKEFVEVIKVERLANLKDAGKKTESYFPYLFPTRPHTPAEIAELVPACVGLSDTEKSSVLWAKYTRAIRGVWVKPTLLAQEQDKAKTETTHKILKVGTEHRKKVIVALTNIKTDDDDWAAMACGKPNLKLDRYKRISELVNQVIKITPRPNYVLFPELSIPLEWVDSIANHLLASGISLIAGTEYRHLQDNKIKSEACLVLADNRLGYPATVKIWQPKLLPAVGEDKELTTKYGKIWDCPEKPKSEGEKKQKSKPIYNHNGFYFGVMVCSELQNTKERANFQGAVDALMVLSWNQDLETFSALIEAAALDIHAYTILVNNRKYGDSRVRSPAKESFERDLARVRGGDNDFVVAVTLDIDKLRAFQSREKRWPENKDPFKPVPEGFKLLKSRRKMPPK